jgi:protein TonB
VLPDIDLSKKVTDEADFSGKGVAGGVARASSAERDRSTRPAVLRVPGREAGAADPGTGNLRYPDMLRSANVEGEVLAQFVVDTSGKYESGTFKVLKSSHDLFTAAVKTRCRPCASTRPRSAGAKVKQLVQQPFSRSRSKRAIHLPETRRLWICR